MQYSTKSLPYYPGWSHDCSLSNEWVSACESEWVSEWDAKWVSEWDANSAITCISYSWIFMCSRIFLELKRQCLWHCDMEQFEFTMFEFQFVFKPGRLPYLCSFVFVGLSFFYIYNNRRFNFQTINQMLYEHNVNLILA
jgi:hypothetical protein